MSAQDEADREVAVIGAPLDLGAGRRGVDMGPSAIRYAGLHQQLVEKLGVRVSDAGNVISPVVETTDMGDEHARYLAQILDLCDRLSTLVAETAERGALPLVLGGDHSVALGSLVGMAKVRGGAGGVVWVDAHGDLNTPGTSPSGNVHGMVLAAALGLAGAEFESDAWPTPGATPGSRASMSRLTWTKPSPATCSIASRIVRSIPSWSMVLIVQTRRPCSRMSSRSPWSS